MVIVFLQYYYYYYPTISQEAIAQSCECYFSQKTNKKYDSLMVIGWFCSYINTGEYCAIKFWKVACSLWVDGIVV